MLNALRHQRLWHISSGDSDHSLSCAQRLAASEVMAFFYPAAKPFSNLIVLNALRHQRLWHIYARTPIRTSDHVLNALRHQRLWHKMSFHLYRKVQLVLNALRHQRLWHVSETP